MWNGAIVFDFPPLVIDSIDSGSSGSRLELLSYLFPYNTLGEYVFLSVDNLVVSVL